MTKKKFIKNNDPSINFRLPKELKTVIENEAHEKGMTTSAYVRELLEQIHNGEYCKNEIEEFEGDTFLFPIEFLKLLVWIHRKRNINKLEIQRVNLIEYIKTLKKLDDYLPEELVKEFDKVLMDVLIVHKDESFAARTKFGFPDSYKESEKFNYKLVEEFILNTTNLDIYLNKIPRENYIIDIIDN